MSDVPAKLWKLPMGRHRGYALAVLARLWGFVFATRKRGGGPFWVFCSLARLADELNVGERQVSQGLTGLAEAGLVRGEWREGQYGYWLMTPPGLEDPLQAPDRRADDPSIGDRTGCDRRAVDLEVGGRKGGDRRSRGGEIVDREGRDRRSLNGGGLDRNEGDRRSENGRSSIELSLGKEEAIAKQLATQLTTAKLASEGSTRLVERARDILVAAAEVFGPRGHDGQLLVGPGNVRAVALLAGQLDVDDQGELRDQALADREAWVRRVVLRYAAICAADPGPEGEGQWWTEVMFSPVPVGPGKPGVLRNPPWSVVVGRVVQRDAADAQRREAERRAAEQAALEVERAAALAEADRRDAEARASWNPARIAEALRGSTAPHAAAVRQIVDQATPLTRSSQGLDREELIERRARLTDAIRAAQDNGEQTKATELSQARLELSRALHALDTQPFGAAPN